MNASTEAHPARLTIDYPARELDRLSTLLRVLYAIPIAVVLGLIGNTFGQPDPQPVTDVCNGQQGFDVALIGSCTVANVEQEIEAPEDEQE